VADNDERLAAEVGEIRKLISERLSNDQVREKAFDELYKELSHYKDDFLFQNEKPLLLDLLLFYDSMTWFQESLVQGEMSQDVIADSFQYLVDEFLEILARRDIAPIEPAEAFDRKIHKAVKVLETDDSDRDNHIDQVLKRGFARADRLLRPEEVVVSRLNKRK
jgi:molecular chaperone GrpE (heat shock protein)